METKNIDIKKIIPNKGQIEGLPKNPRQIRDFRFEKLKQSISDAPEMLSLRELIVFPHDGKFIIIAGNMRYRACQELKIKELPCKILDENTPVEKLREYAIKDNENFGEYDWDIVANEWDTSELEDWGVELPTDWGAELDGEEIEQKEIVEDEIPENVETECKKGEIWQLGRHRLMCGDSTDGGEVALLMNGGKADCVLSDPPYGMNLDTDFSTIKGSMKLLGRKNHTEGNKYEKVIGDNEDFKPELITTFFANFDYVKEMFLFGADYFAEILPDKNKGSWLVWDKRKESQADAIGSEFELIWSRNKHKRRMLRHDWFGFLSSENGADARNRVHPTQKPITLLVDILNQWGKDANIVVDLYGGSGSTLIACEQLNRTCYMMELDPHYCDVIIARWEKLSGGTAVKIEDV